MTAVARQALRAVVLASPEMQAVDSPTRRLLGDLGHRVTRATSPDHALKLLSAAATDLLVVDITDAQDNRRFLGQLCELPASQRPRELAIYSDCIDGELRSLRSRIRPLRMHVFVKPLHVHGLLSVLRRMENDEEAAVLAGA